MNGNPLQIHSQITFLYYHDLQPAAAFYQEIMGLELVEDQGWAKIYRTGRNAYLGIVDEKKGFHQAQEKSAVLVTLAVDDVAAWHKHMREQGVQGLTEPRDVDDIQVRCFFCEDPGGYAIEIEQFLRPDAARIFHDRGGPPHPRQDEADRC